MNKHTIFDSLTKHEEQIIKECLLASIEFFGDWEFSLLFGLEIDEMKLIVDDWPHNKSQPDTERAVLNAFANLISYPHGQYDNDVWFNHISVSQGTLMTLSGKIRGEPLPPAYPYTRVGLIEYLDHGNAVEYLFFWGHQAKGDGTITKSCLSQWYLSFFAVNNIIYATAEHYMMAEKARLFNDLQTCELILHAQSPLEAKTLGKQVKNFDPTVWEKHRDAIVLAGNKAKFSQNAQLAKFLSSTKYKVLVEASPTDPIWGIGLAENDPDAVHPKNWKGLNLLGFTLMRVRDGQ